MRYYNHISFCLLLPAFVSAASLRTRRDDERIVGGELSIRIDFGIEMAALGECEAIVGVTPVEEGEFIEAVQVESIVFCETECMKRPACTFFNLDSTIGGGTCNLYSTHSNRYTIGGDNSFGTCSLPTWDMMPTTTIYIMNAGVGGYLSSRDINPLIKRDGNQWEEWRIEKSGDKYLIKDSRGRHLSAQPSGLVEFRDWASDWERWDIKRISDDAITIKGAHGNYLKAEGNGWVFANAGTANDWEKWRITNNNDIKGQGPDGEFVLAGAVLMPILVLVSIASGGAASGASAALAASTTAAATTVAANTLLAASIAGAVSGILTEASIEIIKQGLEIQGDATRIATGATAFAALF